MRAIPAVLLSLLVPSVALAQAAEEVSPRAPDAAPAVAPTVHPPAPVVVVVESVRPAARPDALRAALAESLGAPVVPLDDAPETPRARIAIAIQPDGRARVHVSLRRGVQASATLPAGEGEPASPPSVAALAREVATFLVATEADLSARMDAHSGLVAWDDEGLRPYPPVDRVDNSALLPWPRAADTEPAADGETPPRTSPSPPHGGAPRATLERADGLSAPRPGYPTTTDTTDTW